MTLKRKTAVPGTYYKCKQHGNITLACPNPAPTPQSAVAEKSGVSQPPTQYASSLNRSSPIKYVKSASINATCFDALVDTGVLCA